MSAPDDGGPAFPIPVPAAYQGMTLRDYFAAAALPALIEKNARYADSVLAAELVEVPRDEDGVLIRPVEEVYDDPSCWEDVAKGAYAVADAMLAARKEQT